MLSGKYPSDLASELEPRITWDRVTDRVSGSRAIAAMRQVAEPGWKTSPTRDSCTNSSSSSPSRVLSGRLTV